MLYSLAAFPELAELPLSQSTTVQAIVGSKVAIQCDIIPSALSIFNIRWQYNNHLMTDENEYMLQLANVSIANSGNYSCSARAQNSENTLPSTCNTWVSGRINQLYVFGKQRFSLCITIITLHLQSLFSLYNSLSLSEMSMAPIILQY